MMTLILLAALLIVTINSNCADGFRYEASDRLDDTPALLDESRLSQVTLPKGLPMNVQFSAPQDQLQAFAAMVAGLPGATHLKVTKDETDELGKRHVRFQQVQPFSGGVATVYGGDLIVHLDKALNTVYSVTGMAVLAINVQLPPTFRRVDAEGRASKEAQRRTPAAPATAAATAAAARTQFASSMELTVVPRSDGDLVVWCGDALFTEDVTSPAQLRVCVNGHGAGEVKESRNVLHTAAVTGTGNSLYSGVITSLATNSLSSGYELRDPTRANFYTNNMNSKTLGSGSIFTDADNVWGSGTTGNIQSAAVDAHYGIQMTLDYYKNMHGRNGIDGTGTKATYNRVHYGRRYNNAFWSDSCFCMTYGDGDGSLFSPLTSLDIAGHEMTHGVTSRTAALTYSGESGGLNEAMSDIFGTMVEFYANSTVDKGDYLIGEKIMVGGGGTKALRYMNNPKQDGRSASCWNSTLGSIDVHYSSGVANYWFYLMSEGGLSVCTGSTVAVPADRAVNRRDAAVIMYRALTAYMTSSTNYAGARAATLSAAADLFGDASDQYIRVGDAWTAVNVV